MTSPQQLLNPNIALHHPAFASSKEGDAYSAAVAFDGDLHTRWASSWSDPQWIYVDLGGSYNINSVVLTWEAYGKNYEIQISDNASQWKTIYSTENGHGGVETIHLSDIGRYVRLYINKRVTEYGDSLFEFEVYGNSVAGENVNVQPVATAATSKINKALRKPAEASSYEDKVWDAHYAVDGNSMTRWSSAFSDPQWIYVDLGSSQKISRVVLNWELAYAKAYKIQVSDDKLSWTDVYSTLNGDGDIDDITLSATGRYVRVFCTERTTEYGFSLWGFEVY
jgi:beta-glucosidase